MAVVFLALGSRGDVQPLAAVAGELVRRGTTAMVVAAPDYRDLVAATGAEFVPLGISMSDILRSARRFRAVLNQPIGQAWLLRRWVTASRHSFAAVVSDVAQPGDTIAAGLLGATAGASLAEAVGGNAVTLLLTPQYPTVHRASHFYARGFRSWAAYNAWGTRLNWRISTGLGGALITTLRARLRLPRRSGQQLTAMLDRHPIALAAGPTLVPPAPDWPAHHHQIGHIHPPTTGDLPVELAEFLAGREPVYVGVGSLTGTTGDEGLALFAAAAERAGRAIVTLATAPNRTGQLTEHLFATPAVPFDLLFPGVAGTIHHAGAGTAHTALRSGRPTVGVPLAADQPYHAERLHALGLGPAPLPFRTLTPARLARLIVDLVDTPRTPGYESRAAELAPVVRAEDGLNQAADLIEELR